MSAEAIKPAAFSRQQEGRAASDSYILFALCTMVGIDSFANVEALDKAYNPKPGKELDDISEAQQFLLKKTRVSYPDGDKL